MTDNQKWQWVWQTVRKDIQSQWWTMCNDRQWGNDRKEWIIDNGGMAESWDDRPWGNDRKLRLTSNAGWYINDTDDR